MKTFTDTMGRTWELSLTISAIKRVKSLLDVDLLALEVGNPPLLTRLGTEVILLCDVIFVLLKPQADACKVTDEQFGAVLGGKVILAAQTAFYEELVDFFHGLGRRDLVKAVKTQQKIIGLVIRRIESKIGQIDLDAAIEEVEKGIDLNATVAGEIEKGISGRVSTDLPVS